MIQYIQHMFRKDTPYAIGVLLGLGLFFFFLNPSQSLNPMHEFEPELVRQDSLLHARQYGQIKYQPFIELISEAQKETSFIKFDTTVSKGNRLRIYMKKEGNGSISEFNSYFFNKSSDKEFPDMKQFLPFLQEELQMKMVSDEEDYGFELHVSGKDQQRYLLIPYQILIALLPQLEESSK